jgi:hypothetical protein
MVWEPKELSVSSSQLPVQKAGLLERVRVRFELVTDNWQLTGI